MQKQMRIKQNGGKVQLEFGGKLVEMPWQSALELVGALRSVTKTAEEHDNAGRIAYDGAILLRAGTLPVGLTNHPAIQSDAAVIAAHDRDLRRYMPGGVRSREHVGTPGVTRHDPVIEERH